MSEGPLVVPAENSLENKTGCIILTQFINGYGNVMFLFKYTMLTL